MHPSPLPMMAAGGSSFLGAPGKLFLSGSNGSGQLGDGTTTSRSTLVQLGTGNWVAIAAGSGHFNAIREDGTLWGCGLNSGAQIGDGTTVDKSSPVQVGSQSNWHRVFAGISQVVFATKQDGTLWVWGAAGGSGFGRGTGQPAVSSPVQVGSATNWKDCQILVGQGAVAALKTNGYLYTWGANSYGELGQSTMPYGVIYSPTRLGANTWLKLGGGKGHRLAIRSDGTLWSWGLNNYRQLGWYGSNLNSPAQVGAASNWSSVMHGSPWAQHSVAHRSDGSLWTFGQQNFGKLGLGAVGYAPSPPTQVGALTDWNSGKPPTCGRYTTLTIKSDGTLWGMGRTGNYGIPLSGAYRSSPVQIGSGTGWLEAKAGMTFSILRGN